MLPLFTMVCLLASSLSFGAQVVQIGPEDRTALLQLAEGPEKRPLVLVLHGFGMDAESIDQFFNARRGAEQVNYHALIPEGRVNQDGARFWAATDACCDFFGPEKSDTDVNYLMELVHEAVRSYPVRKNEIYIVGFSNGGFMANRLACEYSNVFEGVASFAGANYRDIAQCQPKRALSYLQVHGTVDAVIGYDGGSTPKAAYPSARATTDYWAGFNRCKNEIATSEAFELSQFNLDLNAGLPSDEELPQYFDPGNETDQLLFDNCRGRHQVALWTMNGLGHAPLYLENILVQALDFIAKPMVK
ncbi:alpha/beta hydrolase family esterase [Pseudobacteriovorax antillogorgiicola]|uniref:Polyhydroxybutyrate depolymerase n=1 Tax=Pseudobacteriovorax antillogorgiicola TaxID=1513793 RepID=A0A1Y6CBX8_9BACT|nr:PHB depolymerase family esterase [Pseudobacteriovorax antillogorgiicola]TCS49900.1 polyhydroxybutyrate depolymerase [Pseudobacteriovorax antillogorgiicola]SMF44782.1 polyhydroxybutyrate depolymerase [Pseudobacteriovorax antillogorgiicola]